MANLGFLFLGNEDRENIMSISKLYNVTYEEAEKAYKEILEKLGVKVEEPKEE